MAGVAEGYRARSSLPNHGRVLVGGEGEGDDAEEVDNEGGGRGPGHPRIGLNAN